MYNFLINNVNGAVVLDTRRPKQMVVSDDSIEKKPKLYPVKFRITYLRNRLYIKAGFDFTLSDWNILPTSKQKDFKDTRKLIKASFDRLEQTVKDIIETGEYSHEKLIKLLKKGRTDSLQDAFDNAIHELKKEGQVGSAGVYSNTIKSLTSYKKNLKYKDITCKFLNEYQKSKENELAITTIGIYLRTLRAVFNRAITDKTITEASYPFRRNEYDGKYQIPESEGSKIALTLEQVAAMINYQPRTKIQERSRDMFLLSFHLGGINFKDLLLLKWSDFKNNEITYVREKTKRNTRNKVVKITIPVTDAAKRLIDNLGDTKGVYILPYMKADATPAEILKVQQNVTRLTNKHLGTIGKDLGIEGISTMVARHSVATILKNSGVPVAFISETLGHSNVLTTQSYLKGFESAQRKKNFEVISQIGKNGN